jgi:hypothetical protein
VVWRDNEVDRERCATTQFLTAVTVTAVTVTVTAALVEWLLLHVVRAVRAARRPILT